MTKRLDLVGQRFGRLLVQEFAGKDKNSQSYWNCICDCGNATRILGQSLRNGDTQSCGCFHKEQQAKCSITHGQNRGGHITKSYRIWAYMIQRCNNPNNLNYKHYGGRGIKVCERWLKFENFYEDVGDVPEGMTFDRRDNERGYEPDNWRWATWREQQNNRRNNIWKTYNGETKTITQWERSLGISRGTLWMRLNKGWSDERAFNTPIRALKK